MAYQCQQCETKFNKLSELKRHQRIENHWKKYDCDVCGKWFTRKDNLEQHKKKHVASNNWHCEDCGQTFTRIYTLNRHRERAHQYGGGRKRTAADQGDNIVTKKLKKDDDPRKYYTLTKIKDQKIIKFKTKASSFRINFHDIEISDDVLATLRRIFNAIFHDVTIGNQSRDLVRLTVQSPSLDYPIIIPFLKIDQLTANRFMAEVERVLQSNEDFTIDSGLLFEVTIVNMPIGKGRKRPKYVNIGKFLLDKRCIIQIQNDDELCCARAIITAKARLDKHEKWNSIRIGKSLQRELAEQLHKEAGVPYGKCGIEQIKTFQRVLSNYQIYVVSKDHFNAIIFSGPDSEKKLYLYYHDDHFDVITSMAAFLGRNNFCTTCNKGYDHKEDHACNNVCNACRAIHEPSEEDWIQCDTCFRFFQGQECYRLHIKTTNKGNSTCKTIHRCCDCGKTVNKKIDKKHICGQIYCKCCKDFFEEGHKCYMLREEKPLPQNGKIVEKVGCSLKNAKSFIFFDFECTQDDLSQCDAGYKPDVYGKCQNCLKSTCGSLEHKPNLCIAQKVCEVCMDKIEVCNICGKREVVFTGENTLDSFCQWLFSEENNNCTVLCHNFQGYDSYPILQYLYKNAIVPTVIPNGAKIMCLSLPSCKIKMIDSINFLPMALAKLPDMFGFSELRKGYFPHLFNRKENQRVVLNCLPDSSFYNPDSMKPDDRKIFFEWYQEHKYETFDLQAELLGYCRSDVDILRRCCLKFRKDFMDITEIDPFERCITIASACNLVFRTNFLQDETIAIIPHQGYNPEQKQSTKALQWMKYISHTQGHRIQHVKNGGEKSIGPYLVDGYYETKKGEKVVLEFNGDFWHGNPSMYARSTINPVNQLTMGDLYDKTLEKKKILEELGYSYISIWESDFDQQCLENPIMKIFIENLDLVTPLEPRDAFYGGRTEAYTLYKEASPTDEIDYYDVTSLYPWINKTGKIPMGHPEITTENFKELNEYEGLIKCKMLPPKGLFHPVLPCKVNGKLLFHLCKVCAESQQQTPCCHSSDERAFVGTWVTDEVKTAVNKGYKLLHIYEVWHFEKISQYDPDTLQGGLFTDYVNTFLKLKQEASGWPTWVTSEEDKQKYIDRYEQKEGVLLEYHNIEKNPGRRALAKLMLNSFWGKFGQRSNMSQVEFVKDPSIFFDKLTSDQEEVTAVNFISEDMVEMRWKYRNDFVDTNSKTNVVIAAYTTAQARLKLYSFLEKLGPRTMYADTDSIIFSSQREEWKPDLGDFLGDLTNEIPKNRIQTFATGGPKNYGFELQFPDKTGCKTHCKVRGITLNYRNLSNVNFDVLKNMVTRCPDTKVSVPNAHKISRDRDSAQLRTISQNKDYQLVFDKRVIRDNFVSFHMGINSDSLIFKLIHFRPTI